MNEVISLIELCVIFLGEVLFLNFWVQILLWTARYLSFAFLLSLNQYLVQEEGKGQGEGIYQRMGGEGTRRRRS